jgi:hypothetical protein
MTAAFRAWTPTPTATGATSAALDWMTPFTEVKDVSFDKADFHVRWFADGC